MKKLFVILALLSLPVSAAIKDGNERGNGGDEYAKEFIRAGLNVAQILETNPIHGVDLELLRKAIRETKVNSRVTLSLRGNEVDAINYPDALNPRILLSRTAWDRLKDSPHRRDFLAFHEYLGIMGVDDSNYAYSLRLDGANVCGRDIVIRKALENQFQKLCYHIKNEDLYFLRELHARYNPWMGEGVFRNLRAGDLAGLEQLRTFSYFDRLASVPTDFLRGVPELSFLALLVVQNVPKFDPHSELSTLRIGELEVAESVAEGAFAHLTKLGTLVLHVDGSKVDFAKALKGTKGLYSLIAGIHNVSEVPFSLLRVVRANPHLKDLVFPGKNLESALSKGLMALGFRCNKLDPGSVLCTKSD